MTRFLFPTLGSNNDRIFSLHFFSNQKLGGKKMEEGRQVDSFIFWLRHRLISTDEIQTDQTAATYRSPTKAKVGASLLIFNSLAGFFFIFQTIRPSPRFFFFLKKSCPIFPLPPSPIIFNVPKIRLVYLARHERHRQLVSIRSKRVDRRYQLIKPILILKFFPTNLPSTLLQKNINADAARIESAAIFCCLCRPL